MSACESFTAQQAGQLASLHVELNPDHGGINLAHIKQNVGNSAKHEEWLTFCAGCGWHACIIDVD